MTISLSGYDQKELVKKIATLSSVRMQAYFYSYTVSTHFWAQVSARM